VAVAALGMVCALMATSVALTQHYLAFSRRRQAAIQARLLAEAGAQRAIAILRSNPAFGGEAEHRLGPGEVATTVSGRGRTRTIRAVGIVRPAGIKTVRRAVVVRVSRPLFGDWRIQEWKETRP
jgi:hypothetical protein